MAYQYGSCSKRKPQLGPIVVEISNDVRIRRNGQSNTYFVEVYDYGYGWRRYSTVCESRTDAESRARYAAGF